MTNINHNNREFSEKQKAQNEHIDYNRSDNNIYLVQDDLKELYEREFSEPLQKYNDKQKRNDRKIDSYYNHIKDSKKTALQQEIIVQVGDKDDFQAENYKAGSDFLEDWFEDFQERNPNLKVYNAVIHNDEATPHLHVNFVPVASGYKRGLEKQVSFDRAIKQQDQTLDKQRPFDDWREKEVEVMGKLLQEKGHERKLVGTNDFKDVNDYKAKKDLEREIKTLEKDLSQKKNELVNLTNEQPKKIKTSGKYEVKNVEVPTGKKFLGKELTETQRKRTGNIVLPEKEYRKLVKEAEQNQQLKAQVEKYLTTDLVQENKNLQKVTKEFMDKFYKADDIAYDTAIENEKLLEENKNLKEQVKSLKKEIGTIYLTVKDTLKRIISDSRQFKDIFKGITHEISKNAPRGEFERLNRNENKTRKRSGPSL